MIDARFQQVINKELKLFFTRKLKDSQKIDQRLPKFIDQIAGVTLRGGDRMRPYFCWLGYQISHNKPNTHNSQPTTILPVLLALELTHTFALIHDDIMDKAKTRRGGPTIHAYFTKNLRTAHLGMSLAVLAGDLAYLWADELFDEITPPNPLLRRGGEGELRHLFNTMREETIHGQIRDVWGMQGEATRELIKMYDLKSGRYSVEKPLLIGATLGGGDTKLLVQLSNYGRNVGLAFQIQDDILGVFGDKKSTGKSVSSDIEEGKWTVLISETYVRLDAPGKKKLLDLFKRGNVASFETDWVKKQIKTSRALETVEKMMRQYVTKALQNIKELPVSIQTELKKVAQFAISRKI